MNIYLNTNTPLENFKILTRSKFFIDKSMILKNLNTKLETFNKYICITKPRKFGKTSIADMLGAYYSKAFNSR
ncbi:MAG: AAA family ATPase [Clostridium sp.]|nr:AAA family ATPase [Clostridium sp.]MCI7443352.1 AAA family ATPase [Clostridium sp.]